MPYIHKQLAAGRWFTLTLIEQLANIGSEVECTIRATKAGEEEQKERAFARMLELLDLTLADPRHQEQQQALLRLRELLCDVFQGENVSNTSFEWLSQHFLESGIAARMGR
jgi:hypothetical protein